MTDLIAPEWAAKNALPVRVSEWLEQYGDELDEQTEPSAGWQGGWEDGYARGLAAGRAEGEQFLTSGIAYFQEHAADTEVGMWWLAAIKRVFGKGKP